jgi:multiple sugar transport system permease protein
MFLSNRTERRKIAKGLLFISPWLLGFFLFTIYPMLASFYFSFTRYDVLRPPKFIGFENYIELFTGDDLFRTAMYNTVWFVLVAVPIGLVAAFLLAVLLNQNLRGKSVYRTIFFIPSITPAVASVMVWLWIYNTQYGLINGILIGLGLEAIPWLSSPALAKPSLVVIQVWAQGTAIIIFLAALQDVPRTLYEAARVDGANALQRFWHVTVPMTTPAMLYVLLTGLIGTFQAFIWPWLLTRGGPNNATLLFSVYLYRSAFEHFKMGYASAQGWLLFILVITFAVFIFKTSARWVYYGGE